MNPEVFRKFVLELANFHAFKIVNDHADEERIQVHVAIPRWTSRLHDIISRYVVNGHLHLIENRNETYIYEITLLEGE